MKPTIRFLVCAAIVLSVVCASLAPVLAQDATDCANQLYQAQNEREECKAPREQAQKERDDWHAQHPRRGGHRQVVVVVPMGGAAGPVALVQTFMNGPYVTTVARNAQGEIISQEGAVNGMVATLAVCER